MAPHKCSDDYHIYWKDTAATITLVSKIGVETIQIQPPFNAGKLFLSPYFHNQLWGPLSVATIHGVVSNQINTAYKVI